jgi:hypothetical protein
MRQISMPEHGDRVDERDTIFVRNGEHDPVYSYINDAWQVSVDRGHEIEIEILVRHSGTRWITVTEA